MLLKDLIEHFSSLNLGNEHCKADILDQAYEYLIKKFADLTNKKAGEFCTPRSVVALMVRILAPKAGEIIYDLACWTGGILLEALHHVKEHGVDENLMLGKLYGQEGLDFYTWCHAVVHWNLPSNPVDLEQREGRVHRNKGHAVRKNIAERYGLTALSDSHEGGDPWQTLFLIASRGKSDGHSDLIPYWIFEDGSARVERRIPLLPYSKEVGKLKRLKQGLALYRMVFGQPRQEDLLFSLSQNGSHESADLADWLISLQPPVDTAPNDKTQDSTCPWHRED